jgi:hypothetical protein
LVPNVHCAKTGYSPINAIRPRVLPHL